MEKIDKVIAGMEACNGVGEDCKRCPYACEGEKCSGVLWAEAKEALLRMKAKYDTAIEMAAIATELAAKYRKEKDV